MLNLAMLLESSAQKYPSHLAVIFNETRLTYAQLNGAANQLANGLRALGVKRGDKVALSCPNIPYFPIAYYAILKVGATVVPFNVLFKPREVAYHLKDSDAVAMIVFEGTPELPMAQMALAGFQEVPTCRHLIVATANPAAPPPVEGEGVTTLGRVMAGQPPVFDTVQTMPDDTAVILYTSGTTGSPKGAELTHANMVLNAIATRDMVNFHRDDVALTVLPLFHSFGQTVLMNTAFTCGATITLLPRFTPDAVLGIMQRDGVTIFAGVPTMYWALMNYPDAEKFDLAKIRSTLRLAVSGGAALPLEVLKGFEARFEVPILEGYGLSETSPVACFNQLDRPRKPGSIGQPIWLTEMRVVDPADPEHKPLPPGQVGEVVIRGHQVMKGYYKRPEATAEAIRNDWFHSGDLGKTDEEGYFYIVDRLKEMIIRGGFNVYPRELEEYLMTHPKVSLVAVKGVPDEKLGEEVKAYIVLKPGETATAEEILEYARQGLASYKYPRYIEFRSSLPMTATGKILKRELVDEG
ncbi:MAG: long-chain fatty acid--CoA ligase [Caldilineales bacterium]|nr:long-chain fatty acid--CoA ligase [Caldilineales bacterium]MDW8318414.1 long-chain fatty acid--CoA ligase [Anaerolineae bacterium]